MVACGRRGRGLKREMRKLKTQKSIELKRFLDTYFNTKNYLRTLDLWLGHRFHHLTETNAHLFTTLIGLIRDMQSREYKVTTLRSFKLNLRFQIFITEYKRDAQATYKAHPSLSSLTR